MTRVLLALALCSVIPSLLLAWTVFAVTIPSLGAEETLMRGGLRFLVAVAVLGMIVGGYIIWDIGETMARLAQMMAGERGDLEHRHDDVGTLMHAFTKMLGTIDKQAAEINSFASRLDTAYNEMESTNARLKELVLKDEMTGLYNRRFFLLRLEEEIAGFRRFKHPLSVLFLHLDDVEDLPLMEREDIQREFAAILLEHTHGTTVVSRYDGNRFAVLLVATSEIVARVYLGRIHEVVGKYSFAHGKVVTMRVGAVTLSDDQALPADVELLLAAADAVLRR